MEEVVVRGQDRGTPYNRTACATGVMCRTFKVPFWKPLTQVVATHFGGEGIWPEAMATTNVRAQKRRSIISMSESKFVDKPNFRNL